MCNVTTGKSIWNQIWDKISHIICPLAFVLLDPSISREAIFRGTKYERQGKKMWIIMSWAQIWILLRFSHLIWARIDWDTVIPPYGGQTMTYRFKTREKEVMCSVVLISQIKSHLRLVDDREQAPQTHNWNFFTLESFSSHRVWTKLASEWDLTWQEEHRGNS